MDFAREGSVQPEDQPQEGFYCTLHILRKKDGAELSRYPIDGEKTVFGRDETADVRLYYPEVSRVHAELVFNEERKAQLNILSSRGVIYNNVLVEHSNTSTITLNAGDVFGIGRKRFSISYPNAAQVQLQRQAEVSTPRRPRPSTRLSLIPKDVVLSPQVKEENPVGMQSPLKSVHQTSSKLQTPLKPFSALVPGPLNEILPREAQDGANSHVSDLNPAFIPLPDSPMPRPTGAFRTPQARNNDSRRLSLTRTTGPAVRIARARPSVSYLPPAPISIAEVPQQQENEAALVMPVTSDIDNAHVDGVEVEAQVVSEEDQEEDESDEESEIVEDDSEILAHQHVFEVEPTSISAPETPVAERGPITGRFITPQATKAKSFTPTRTTVQSSRFVRAAASFVSPLRALGARFASANAESSPSDDKLPEMIEQPIETHSDSDEDNNNEAHESDDGHDISSQEENADCHDAPDDVSFEEEGTEPEGETEEATERWEESDDEDALDERTVELEVDPALIPLPETPLPERPITGAFRTPQLGGPLRKISPTRTNAFRSPNFHTLPIPPPRRSFDGTHVSNAKYGKNSNEMEVEDAQSESDQAEQDTEFAAELDEDEDEVNPASIPLPDTPMAQRGFWSSFVRTPQPATLKHSEVTFNSAEETRTVDPALIPLPESPLVHGLGQSVTPQPKGSSLSSFMTRTTIPPARFTSFSPTSFKKAFGNTSLKPLGEQERKVSVTAAETPSIRRASLGPPIRMPKTPIKVLEQEPETMDTGEDTEEEREDSEDEEEEGDVVLELKGTTPLYPITGAFRTPQAKASDLRRISMARAAGAATTGPAVKVSRTIFGSTSSSLAPHQRSALSSAPRQLAIPTLEEMKQTFTSPVKPSAARMTLHSNLLPADDNSSDEERTPMQSLAKKIDALRRKSLAASATTPAKTSLLSIRKMVKDEDLIQLGSPVKQLNLLPPSAEVAQSPTHFQESDMLEDQEWKVAEEPHDDLVDLEQPHDAGSMVGTEGAEEEVQMTEEDEEPEQLEEVAPVRASRRAAAPKSTAPKATRGTRAITPSVSEVEEDLNSAEAEIQPQITTRRGRITKAASTRQPNQAATKSARAPAKGRKDLSPTPPIETADEADPLDSIAPDEAFQPAAPTVKASIKANSKVTTSEQVKRSRSKKAVVDEEVDPVIVPIAATKTRGRAKKNVAAPVQEAVTAAAEEAVTAPALVKARGGRRTLASKAAPIADDVDGNAEVIVRAPAKAPAKKKNTASEAEEDKENVELEATSTGKGTPAAVALKVKVAPAAKGRRAAASKKVPEVAQAEAEAPVGRTRATRSRK